MILKRIPSELEKRRRNTKLTDDALSHLATLKSLRRLCRCRNVVTDIGLKRLTPLKNLETLKLGETEVTEK